MPVTHGDAEVSYGNGEKPRYSSLRQAINGYYQDLLKPLATLRSSVFMALPMEDRTKAEAEPFRYTAAERRTIDHAVDLFLAEMAGPDRTKGGFVHGGPESDTPDGVIQQRDVLTYAIGIKRGADLLDKSPTLAPARTSPAVTKMLEHAFERLSEDGKLRLEGIRDEVHGLLVAAQDAGLSPLETGRELSARFDQYQDWEFQRLARTEAAFASEAGVRDQMSDMGVERVQVLVSADACEICEPFDEQVFDIDDDDNLPPYHPNCLCSTAPAAEDESGSLPFGG